MDKTIERELFGIIVQCINYDDDFGVHGFNDAVDEILRRFKLTPRGKNESQRTGARDRRRRAG